MLRKDESTAQENEEKRDHIIYLLTDLALPTEKINSAKEELANDIANFNNISVTTYLDQYLIPFIPDLNRMREATNLSAVAKTENKINWEHLILLCFSGNLSQTIWDAIWVHLKNDEKVYCMTAKFYGQRSPLGIAATNGNMAALRRIDAAYQELLSKHPEYRRHLHDQLEDALIKMRKCTTTDEHKTAYLFLLNMCWKYAIIDPMAKVGFSNKNFVENENTMILSPLLAVFDRICEYYSKQRYEYEETAWAIHQLSLYVKKNGTLEDYCHFEENLSNILKKNLSLQKEVSKLQQNPPEVILLENADILISLGEDSEQASPLEPTELNIKSPKLIVSTDTPIQNLTKTNYPNLFSENNDKSMSSKPKQKEITQLEDKIRLQVAIYDSKINTEKKARFPSRKDIELWEKKKNVLNFACELLLDEKTEPASLQLIEGANRGWDKGKEAKALVNQVKKIRGVPLNWKDYYSENLSSAIPLKNMRTKK